MISGHSANPIFFHKKVTIGRPEHLLTPHFSMSNSILFFALTLTPKPTSLKVDVICASPLTIFRITRNSISEVLCKKGVVKNITKFTKKHFCQNLFFNRPATLTPANQVKIL